MESCAECGYSYGALERADLPAAIRDLGPLYADLLSAEQAALRAHPLDGVWSALEYACHLRDVLRVQRERLLLALSEDRPTFASMRREERVTEERYNEQVPSVVAQELNGAAEALAAELERLDEHGWQRVGIYNWPTTAQRTVEWIARHTVHEGRHHIMDIDRLLALKERSSNDIG